jgi:hypothetical protein
MYIFIFNITKRKSRWICLVSFIVHVFCVLIKIVFQKLMILCQVTVIRPFTLQTIFCLQNMKMILCLLYPVFQDHVNLNMTPWNQDPYVLKMKVHIKDLILVKWNISDNISWEKIGQGDLILRWNLFCLI